MNKLCFDAKSLIYPEAKKISLSVPFPTKSRCKRCGTRPMTYYYLMGRYLRYDAKQSNELKLNFIKKICKRMCADYYQLVPPKYFNTLAAFSHNTNYKSFLPKLHRTRGRGTISNLVEFLLCKCGATSWAFNENSTSACPEVVNRKCKHKYPNSFFT